MLKKMLIICQILTVVFMSGCTKEMSNKEVLENALEMIEISKEVTGNLTLPTSLNVDGHEVSATWQSTASGVISPEGVVVVGVDDKNATLIVTLEYNGETLQHNFDITVLGSEDFLTLYVVANTVVDVPINSIDNNIELPTQYEFNGKVIDATWSTSNENIVSASGVVTLGNKIEVIELYLTLSLNGIIREQVYSVTVEQDPTTMPAYWWHTAQVFTGEIENEASKPHTPGCFPGAIYRKVVSSRDYWLGIETTVTLPEFIPDVNRYDDSKPSYFLDNPSIYLGGNSYKESDVGLTWSIGYENRGDSHPSDRGIAFRPFWRYITSLEDCRNNNCYQNAPATNFEFYYYPGDKIQMSVFSPKPGYLQMRIELLELTTHPDYVNKRDHYGLADDFERVFITDMFPSAGMGDMAAEFKRVNAIDQVSNEAKPTINTDSKVVDAIWHEVYLYRLVDGELVKVPFVEERAAYMTCPLGANENGDFTNAFEISYDGVDQSKGGERVTINPNNGNGKLYNTVASLPKKKEYE